MSDRRFRIVIVGGGFAGLAAAKALSGAPAEVFLLDRSNHHLFQPLLYQVATAELSPGQIAAPLRELLRNQENVTVLMAEVGGVDVERKEVLGSAGDRMAVRLAYDFLILATGARHSYFGHDEFERYAPGLKSLPDAVAIRNRILRAFELAETEENPDQHRDLLTFVLVGGGPAGVEMAAAIAVLAETSLRRQFRRIDPRSIRILLVDGGARILAGFQEGLSTAAARRLKKLGVEVRSGVQVTSMDENGVFIGDERIFSRTVIWTAGVAPSPAGKWLGAPTDRAGRVRVAPDLSVPGHPEIFVAGDTASLDHDGIPLPGVAQVAIQQGRYIGQLLGRRLAGQSSPSPFRYFDKGTMAVVGKGYAVIQSHGVEVSGFPAWLAWVAVHLQFLAESSLKISVLVQWLWTSATAQRGARLIVTHHGEEKASIPLASHDNE